MSAPRATPRAQAQTAAALDALRSSVATALPAPAPTAAATATDPTAAIRGIVDRLLGALETEAPGAGELLGLLHEAIRIEDELEHQADLRRLERRTRAEDALERLRAVGDPDVLLRRVAEEALHACDVERALLGRIERETWTAVAGAGTPAPDPSAIAVLPLSAMPVEHEVVESRRPFLENDATRSGRTHPVLGALLAPSRVIVPIVPSDAAIGLLHLDRPGDPGAMDLHDRDLAWWFAQGVGRLYERAVLRRRLAAQRALVEDTARAALNAVPALSDVLELSGADPAALLPRHPLEDQPLDDALLTPREREVAELLAAGHSNREIAARLVIEPATTRSHMQRILRKLGAQNRAQAVALYLRRRNIAPPPDD